METSDVSTRTTELDINNKRHIWNVIVPTREYKPSSYLQKIARFLWGC
jgi:hypothetical protein